MTFDDVRQVELYEKVKVQMGPGHNDYEVWAVEGLSEIKNEVLCRPCNEYNGNFVPDSSRSPVWWPADRLTPLYPA